MALLFIYVLIGIFAGLLAGLLGIGGGIIVVPSLFLLFHYIELNTQYPMQIAIGTSLAAMIFTSFSSAFFHHLSKRVFWHYFYPLAPGIIVGTILGALIADYLPSKILGIIFGINLFLTGIYFLLPSKLEIEKQVCKEIHPLLLCVSGIGIGILSSLLGIGGGILTVPLLVCLGTPLKNAISTSAATGFLIALFGAVSFLAFGLKQNACHGCIGYLYLSAFIVIGLASSLAAPFGVKLVHLFPTHMLRNIFGVILIAAGLWIFIINQYKPS